MSKTADEFNKRAASKDGLRVQCKQCENEYNKRYRALNRDSLRAKMKQWSENNPEKRRANQKKITNRRKQIVREAKDKPCVDCGTHLPPGCMELDHVRGVKKFSLSAAHAYSEKRIREEIAKCDVRCPNCHKLRHHMLRQRGRSYE